MNKNSGLWIFVILFGLLNLGTVVECFLEISEGGDGIGYLLQNSASLVLFVTAAVTMMWRSQAVWIGRAGILGILASLVWSLEHNWPRLATAWPLLVAGGFFLAMLFTMYGYRVWEQARK